MKKSCVLIDVFELDMSAAGTDFIKAGILSIEGTMVGKNST